jgi:hypothetical protein
VHYIPPPSLDELMEEFLTLAEQRLSGYPNAFLRFKNESGSLGMPNWFEQIYSLRMNLCNYSGTWHASC